MSDSPALMDAAAVAMIAAGVTSLAQIIKRSAPGDLSAWGPLLVAVLSALAVALWVWSAPVFPPARTDVWAIVAGWFSVFSSAVGIYEVARMTTNALPAVLTAANVAEPHEHLEPEPADSQIPRPSVLSGLSAADIAAEFERRISHEHGLTEPVVQVPVPRPRSNEERG